MKKGRMTKRAIDALKDAGFEVYLGVSDRRAEEIHFSFRNKTFGQKYVLTFDHSRDVISFSKGSAFEVAYLLMDAGLRVEGNRSGSWGGRVTEDRLIHLRGVPA
jgi:hypothetical protein